MLKTLIAAAGLSAICIIPALGANPEDRMQAFDKQIHPLLEQFRGQPSPDSLQNLARAVEEFNRPKPRVVSEKPVESLEPLWLSTQLREKNVTTAALSMCGGELPSCDVAKIRLQTLTEQCSRVFLGVIDVERYPGTPRNLYDAADPRLILLIQHPELKTLTPVGVMGTISQDMVAVVLCPEESKAFGHVLRALSGR